MKLAVLGGTGRVGAEVVKKALEENMKVKALVRQEEKASDLIPGAEFIVGNVKNKEDVKQTIKGCDAVFSALSTDKTDTLSTALPLIISAMEEEKITRIVTIGTAGILNSRCEQGKYRFQTSESKRKKTSAAEEHAKVYQFLKHSRLEWTIICPTYLPDGDEKGGVRFEHDYLPEEGKEITVGDTAAFAYNEIRDKRFLHHRIGICY